LLAEISSMWLVRDSNPRRLSQLIYSQFPLAAWVTSHAAKSKESDLDALKGYQYLPNANYLYLPLNQ
jgi:hypothetical protein